jgi:hypothetical protein
LQDVPVEPSGLEQVRVLEVARGGDGRLHVAVETVGDRVGCPECGVRAEPKDRTGSNWEFAFARRDDVSSTDGPVHAG